MSLRLFRPAVAMRAPPRPAPPWPAQPKALHSAMLVEDIKRLSEEEQVFQTERFSAGRFRDRLSAFGRRMEVQGLLGPTRSR